MANDGLIKKASALIGVAAAVLVVVEFIGVDASPGPWIAYVTGAYGILAAIYCIMRFMLGKWAGAASGLILAAGTASFFVLTEPTAMNTAGFAAVIIGAAATGITALTGK